MSDKSESFEDVFEKKYPEKSWDDFVHLRSKEVRSIARAWFLEGVNHQRKKIDELQEQSVADIVIREKLLHENEILMEAVEFYADEKNWRVAKDGRLTTIKHSDRETLSSDARLKDAIGGLKARQALKKVKGEG